MNGFVAAIAELVEHTTSVKADLNESEAYSLRLGLILQDEAFAESVAHAHLDVDDLPLMSAGSWAWYLRWRSVRAPTPSWRFLGALYRSSFEGAIRRSIIHSVVNSPRVAHDAVDLEQDLGTLLVRTFMHEVPVPEPARARFGDYGNGILELADYLLEIGTSRSLAIFSSIMTDRPAEHDRMVGLVYDHISELSSYEPARAQWLASVGLPETQAHSERHDERLPDIPLRPRHYGRD